MTTALKMSFTFNAYCEPLTSLDKSLVELNRFKLDSFAQQIKCRALLGVCLFKTTTIKTIVDLPPYGKSANFRSNEHC